MFCAPIYWLRTTLNKDLDRLNRRSHLMNEFLLFAFIIVYLVIRHGTPNTETSSDRQERENEQPLHSAGKQQG